MKPALMSRSLTQDGASSSGAAGREKTRKVSASTPGQRPDARRIADADAVPVGRVSHYFPGAGAALVTLDAALSVGDIIHVRGHTTDLIQRLDRIERHGRGIADAEAGQEVGIAVSERVRVGDRVFKVAL